MPAQDTIPATSYRYLALGDSYTIGESVPAADNYPTQAVALLKAAHINFNNPRIIAQTGWTTAELEQGIKDASLEEPLLDRYDFVSLLIGVNNQYRGQSAETYQPGFEALLQKAIHFAGDRTDHVLVVSIPDWGVTPFAAGRDRVAITKDIDAYNAVNRAIASKYKVFYLDITGWTREASANPTLLANDGLHPSAKEYNRWAEKIAERIKTVLGN